MVLILPLQQGFPGIPAAKIILVFTYLGFVLHLGKYLWLFLILFIKKHLFIYLFYKTSYPKEEVMRTYPCLWLVLRHSE